MTNLPNLFIPQKQTSVTDPTTLPVNWRAVERWASGIKLPSGGGGAYASLTGPGETTTPGDLHQAGGFFVDDSAGTGIYFNSTGGGFYWHSTADPTTNASGGVYIDDTGTGATGGPAGFLQIQTDGELHINSGQSSHSMAGYPVSGMYIRNTGYGNSGGDGLYITNQGDGGLTITDRPIPGVTTTTGGLVLEQEGTAPMQLLNYGSDGILIQNSSSGLGSLVLTDNGNGLEIINTTAKFISLATAGVVGINAQNATPVGGAVGSVSVYTSSHMLLQRGSQAVHMFVNSGNPNGVISAAKGDICFDNTTPGIWLATAVGTSSWTMYTLP